MKCELTINLTFGDHIAFVAPYPTKPELNLTFYHLNLFYFIFLFMMIAFLRYQARNKQEDCVDAMFAYVMTLHIMNSKHHLAKRFNKMLNECLESDLPILAYLCVLQLI
ncbi:UNVERIFIED_CONTAM: hypothetical protein NCL1_49683 [Trichonephila clavipes]